MSFFRRKPYGGPRYRLYGLLSRGGTLHSRREITSDAPYTLKEQPLLPDRDRTVCFTGHRHLPKDTQPMQQTLRLVLEKLYQQGYRDFVTGMALGFDQVAAWQVIQLRREHPDVRLIAAIPCPDQAHPWTSRQVDTYERILYVCDRITVLSDRYYDGCMHARNRFMVDHAGKCIAYMVSPTRSGTWSTIRYAVREQVDVLNIAVESEVDAFLRQP